MEAANEIDTGLNIAVDFITNHPSEAARSLETSSPKEVVDLVAVLPRGVSVSLLEKLHPHLAMEVISKSGEGDCIFFLDNLEPGFVARCLSQLPANEMPRFLDLVSRPRRKAEINELLSFDADTAGSMMDTRVITFSPTVTVKQVIDQLRNIRKRQLQMLVVTDEEQKLLGLVPLQDAILAKSSQPLGELMRPAPPRVPATASQDEVNEVFTNSHLPSLPVVDFDDRFLGLVRQDSVVQAIKDQALTDMQTMVGVSRDERALSPPFTSVAKRLPWLNINLLTAFAAAAVVGAFESTIASVTALAVLLPVVAGQSGNTGAQALAVTMRGLALKEINTSQWMKLALKEAAVGAINGTAIAVVCAIAVIIWSKSAGLAAIIFVSMILSMTIASVSGTVIPVILSRFGMDPAQSSSIILTTVTDIMGFLSFLGLATLLMRFI